ncbi:hypothetical protein [Streptomyces sp. NPDC088261]|uniref:hypothetical protein n=1 Tax=Streptomyces sp. NPDC088261 TaxID=3365851 RepID=UPI00381573D4
MANDVDLDKITDLHPDNTQIDAKLKEVGASDWASYSTGSESQLSAFLVDERIRPYLIYRPSKVTMYFGPEHPVGAGVINKTDQTVDHTIQWSDTIGFKIGASLSITAGGSFFDLVKASVTMTLSLDLSKSSTFSDQIKVPVPPNSYGWLTRRGMTTSIESDVILQKTFVTPGVRWHTTSTGYAGNDGRPDSWVTAHNKPNSGLPDLSGDDTSGLITRNSDGVVRFPAVLLGDR